LELYYRSDSQEKMQMATAGTQSTPTQTTFIARNWRDLIRPRKLEVDSESLTETYGKFTCEPLERGFGTTLGNSLRRILLSSLQGTAITAVKIETALHEFTTIPDVVEDVTDIVLNLKQVLLKSRLEAARAAARQGRRGQGARRATSRSPATSGAQPGSQGCWRARGAKLHGAARRHRPRLRQAERSKGERTPVGGSIDSLFSPIRKVNFRDRAARVRQRTSRPSGWRWTNGAVGGRRGGVRSEDPQGPALDLHQLRRGR
jgi:DNA-directed RNA polymerase subunit alpha